jgi:hypothetical protein
VTLRKTIGPERKKATGNWKKQQSDLHPSTNIITVIKTRMIMMGWECGT